MFAWMDLDEMALSRELKLYDQCGMSGRSGGSSSRATSDVRVRQTNEEDIAYTRKSNASCNVAIYQIMVGYGSQR